MIRYDRRSIALAIGLATLAGYVDAIGFLSAGSLFVSFMSGNSTRLGIAAAEGRPSSALVFLGAVALFVTGVIAGSLVAHRARSRRRPAVLAMVACFLAIAALFSDFGWVGASAGAMLLAMGAENAVFQRAGEVSIGVTYITGALVKFGQKIASAIRGGPRYEWAPYAALWGGLVIGAGTGAAAFHRFGRDGLWAGVALACLLAFTERRNRPRYR